MQAGCIEFMGRCAVVVPELLVDFCGCFLVFLRGFVVVLYVVFICFLVNVVNLCFCCRLFSIVCSLLSVSPSVFCFFVPSSSSHAQYTQPVVFHDV